VENYIGKLVVLRSRWNINSNRLGIVVDFEKESKDKFLVMWTTDEGVKMKYHLHDALLPVTNETIVKVKERICNIK